MIKPHSRDHEIHYLKTKKIEYEYSIANNMPEAAKHFLLAYKEAVKKFGVKLEPIQLKLL